MNEKQRVLYLIEVVEEALYQYDTGYSFEEGVEYSDNGIPTDYETEPLKQDVKDLMDQLQSDCTILIAQKKYHKATQYFRVLEKLDMLLDELEK